MQSMVGAQRLTLRGGCSSEARARSLARATIRRHARAGGHERHGRISHDRAPSHYSHFR